MRIELRNEPISLEGLRDRKSPVPQMTAVASPRIDPTSIYLGQRSRDPLRERATFFSLEPNRLSFGILNKLDRLELGYRSEDIEFTQVLSQLIS
jgi:hypothetical protein